MTQLVQAINSISQRQIPKGLLPVTLPFILQATVFRKRGGYHYRRLVSVFTVIITSIVGSAMIIALRILKNDRNSFEYVFKFHSKLVKNLLALDAIVEGKENILDPSQSAVYICNHQTMMDVHFMSSSVPKQASCIAKKSIKYYPFFGQFMMLFRTIFVDRGGNHNDAVAQASQASKQMLEKKTSIWGFPEGTRNGGQDIDLLPFKKGLFYIATQAKVPIVPIVIGNYKHIYDAKKKRLGYGTVNVRVLPAIYTKDIPEDPESVARLMDDVRGQMLAALKEISVPIKKSDKLKRAKI